ncbi:hypothetical protein DZS_35210 [Dickeya ananatis]
MPLGDRYVVYPAHYGNNRHAAPLSVLSLRRVIWRGRGQPVPDSALVAALLH